MKHLQKLQSLTKEELIHRLLIEQKELEATENILAEVRQQKEWLQQQLQAMRPQEEPQL